jgi:membrane protein YqaA with SNARE-associated domain
MYKNKTIKLVFLVAVTLVMRWRGVDWWDAFLLALFGTMVGGIIVFILGDFIKGKNSSE